MSQLLKISQKFFSTPPVLSSRFASSANLQRHTVLQSFEHFRKHASTKWCQSSQKCLDFTKSLESACYVDIDYDAISQALVLNSYWPNPLSSGGWSESITSPSNSRVEVGVLHPGPNPDSDNHHELSLNGHLTILEKDSTDGAEPKATFFAFPSRHHVPQPLQAFQTSFDQPTGLHPTLRLTFPSGPPSQPQPSCKLHAYLTLPSSLFLDRYSLRDELTLQSHNLTTLHALSGATDLEAPEWNVPTWGSASLFELAPLTAGATFPLHLRYLKPSPGGYTNVSVPVPAVFWACYAEEGTKFSTNPFDRVNLGYDGLFGPRTTFYHLQPKAEQTSSGDAEELLRNVTVPVLDTTALTYPYIEPVTILTVLLGFAWVAWKALRPLSPEATDRLHKKVR